MIDKSSDIIYYLEYVVVVPNSSFSFLPGFVNSFGNVFTIEDVLTDISALKKFLLENRVKKVIFVDYLLEYDNIINSIFQNICVEFIITRSLSYLSNSYAISVFDNIFRLYNKGLFKHFAVLDKSLYQVLKLNYDVDYIILDIPISKSNISHDNSIGLINTSDDPNHSYYNELSSIKMLGMTCNISKNITKITKKFLKEFSIKYNLIESSKLICSSEINLYVNFTNNNYLYFLESMDNGIPCIIGNNTFLNDKDLINYLVVKSDDNINEIKDKILFVKDNKDKILKAYKAWRVSFSKNSKDSIENYLGLSIVPFDNSCYEKMITVVVPVYNTSKYLAACLDSIIDARIDDMEILVINDGSTDNSEEIIAEYVIKYPDLIRSINQKNRGLGNVRNVGLKNARGKYILSVDSDDTINKKYIKYAYEYCKKDIDIIVFDWLSITGEGKFETCALDSLLKLKNRYKSMLYATIMPSSCNKIIKKSLYNDNNFKFVENLKYEDLSINPLIFLKSKTIKYFNLPYYEYMIREKSIMRSSSGTDMIDVINYLEHEKDKNSLLTSLLEDFEFEFYIYWWRIEELVFNQMYSFDKDDLKKFIKYIESNFMTVLDSIFVKNNLVIKRISEFDSNIRKYITDRNNAIISGNLFEFVQNSIKKKNYVRLTAAYILYNLPLPKEEK